MDSMFNRMGDHLGSFFEPERFFGRMHMRLLEEEAKAELAEAETNLEKINAVYSHFARNDLFPSLVKDEKDDVEAKRILDNGTMLFHMRQFTDALHMYTRALATTKVGSKIRALAHGNRAAVLMQIGLYQECVVECDRALECGYPESLRSKILSRKERATKMIPKQQDTKYHGEIPSIPENKRNPIIPCASESIAIKSDEIQGKHIVARKDIHPGEILLVEKPFVSILDERDVTTLCDHCLELCYNPIPCDRCTSVLYCSDQCKNQAHQMYHSYECPITLTILERGIPRMRLLGLRIMLQEFHELLKGNPDQGASAQSLPLSRMQEFLKLKAHVNDLPIDELFRVCSTVCIMYYLVKEHTNFLVEDEQHPMFKDLFLSVYCLSRICGVGIISNFKQEEDRSVATGVYSISSLMGHSCIPNVFRFFYGGTAVSRAIGRIRKNEQCCVSYGSPYYETPKVNRQQVLKERYHFDCKCKACERDWPMVQQMRLDPRDYFTYGVLCQRSKSENDPGALDNLIREIKRHLQRGLLKENSVAYTYLTIGLAMCYAKFANHQKI